MYCMYDFLLDLEHRYGKPFMDHSYSNIFSVLNLGNQDKSNREYHLTYIGDDLAAVKWFNMKAHFFAYEGTHSVLQKYTFPQLFDIKEDVKESYELCGNEGYVNAWVMEPVMKIITEKAISMKQYRNIKPSEDFKGHN